MLPEVVIFLEPIVIYNASVIKIYNTTNSLVRFENKNILFNIEKTL
jgi:hypothetical protein